MKVTSRKYPIDQMTREVVKVTFDNKTHWLQLNDILRFFMGNEVYVLGYRNQTVDIGFNIRLMDFKVGRYQGTRRAASYQSEVDVDRLGPVTISMNEPLKNNGFTFYQASFQEEPVVSILSVNRDPGRWIKYLGSLLVVLGTIMLFYFRGYYFVKTKE